MCLCLCVFWFSWAVSLCIPECVWVFGVYFSVSECVCMYVCLCVFGVRLCIPECVSECVCDLRHISHISSIASIHVVPRGWGSAHVGKGERARGSG